MLLTCIKLPFSTKTFVLSFKWPLKTGSTVYAKVIRRRQKSLLHVKPKMLSVTGFVLPHVYSTISRRHTSLLAIWYRLERKRAVAEFVPFA